MSHAVIYRFRVRPEKEDVFIAAWSRLTEVVREHHGTLGSRLHLGDDGVYYAYARWPSRAAYDAAEEQPVQTAARALMSGAIVERLPTIRMDICKDLLTPEG